MFYHLIMPLQSYVLDDILILSSRFLRSRILVLGASSSDKSAVRCVNDETLSSINGSWGVGSASVFTLDMLLALGMLVGAPDCSLSSKPRLMRRTLRRSRYAEDASADWTVVDAVEDVFVGMMDVGFMALGAGAETGSIIFCFCLRSASMAFSPRSM